MLLSFLLLHSLRLANTNIVCGNYFKLVSLNFYSKPTASGPLRITWTSKLRKFMFWLLLLEIIHSALNLPKTYRSCFYSWLFIISSSCWLHSAPKLASHAAFKIAYLFCARHLLIRSHLLPLFKVQIRFTLKYCSHVRRKALYTSISKLDLVGR